MEELISIHFDSEEAKARRKVIMDRFREEQKIAREAKAEEQKHIEDARKERMGEFYPPAQANWKRMLREAMEKYESEEVF